MKVKVVLEPQPEGVMLFMFRPFRDVLARGETKEEALENIKEAIELYLEVLEEKELGKTLKKFVRSEGGQIIEVSL